MNLKNISQAPKWEKEIKTARDRKIAELRAENKSDEEILEALMEMPEVEQFIKNAKSIMPKQIHPHIAVETRKKLKEAFTKTLKDAGKNPTR